MSGMLPRVTLLLAALLWLSACGGGTPAPAGTPVSAAPASTAAASPTATAPALQGSQALEPQERAGGGVSVIVTPRPFVAGAPLAFHVAMDTHMVDLQDDLVKASSLRDESGTLYTPLAWDGDEPGGHHRQGTLKFAALPAPPKSVMLIIRGVAGVKERTFSWELAN